MKTNVRLFPPLEFAKRHACDQIELPEHANVSDLLKELDVKGVFCTFSKENIMIVVEGKVVDENYVLAEGQDVNIMLQPMGG